VTLNSAQFNAARAVGPAAGGVVLGLYGPSWAFLINGLSFLAVVAALFMVESRPTEAPPGRGEGILRQFADGVRYASRHTGIRVALGIVLAFSLLAMPVSTLIPIFARRVYHVGAGRYGWLAAAYGIGAVIGAVLIGVAGDSLPRGRLAVTALLLYVVALVGLGLAPTYAGGLLFVAVAGVSHLAVAAALNTSIQLLVAERVRGRVLAVYLMCLTAGFPVGSLLQSWMAELTGVRTTVIVAGCLLSLVPAYLLVRPGLLDSLDQHTHRRGTPIDIAATTTPGLA
jgi:predicted MFS family arabinose efflux permease